MNTLLNLNFFISSIIYEKKLHSVSCFYQGIITFPELDFKIY